MRLKRVALLGGTRKSCIAVWSPRAREWVPLGDGFPTDMIELLSDHSVLSSVGRFLVTSGDTRGAAESVDTSVTLLPFRPTSFRDASLYEQHNVAATRGLIKKFMGVGPNALLLAWESTIGLCCGLPFPPLRPPSLFWQRPLFYVGNHLNFFTDQDVIPVPGYSTEFLDYELEIGIVVGGRIVPKHGVRNLSEDAAREAIAGFVLLNDWSARGVQLGEAWSRFGFVKSKAFATSMGPVVVTPDEVGDVPSIVGSVSLNGRKLSDGSAAGAQWSPSQLVAFASLGESLFPGELIGMGTLPGCSGIESGKHSGLRAGDVVEMSAEPFGSLTNTVGDSDRIGNAHWREASGDSPRFDAPPRRFVVESEFTKWETNS